MQRHLILALLAVALGLAILWIGQDPASTTPADAAALQADRIPTSLESLDSRGEDAAVKPQVERLPQTSAAAPEEEQSPPDTVLTVYDPQGSPVPGARVVSWIGNQFRWRGDTDEAGQKLLRRMEGAGGYAVVAPGYPVLHREHVYDGNPVNVHLPAGRSVEGRLLFPVPRRGDHPLTVRLQTWPKEGGGSFGALTEDQLRDMNIMSGSMEASVNEHGHFRFDGLPADWMGRLWLPNGLLLCAVEAPATIVHNLIVGNVEAGSSLTLHVAELPALRGRVVDSQGNPVLDEISVRVKYRLQGSPFEQETSGQTGKEGRFSIPIVSRSPDLEKAYCRGEQPTVLEDVHIRLESGFLSLQAEYRPDLGGLLDPWDVGDLALSEEITVHYLALDVEGNPISGAIAYGTQVGSWSGADGMGRIEVRSGDAGFLVGALGYSPEEVPIPEDPSQVVEVTLTSSAQVDITILPMDLDLSQVRLRVLGKGGLFEGDGESRIGFADYLHLSTGLLMRSSGEDEEGRQWSEYLLEQMEVAKISSLQPGIPLTL